MSTDGERVPLEELLAELDAAVEEIVEEVEATAHD